MKKILIALLAIASLSITFTATAQTRTDLKAKKGADMQKYALPSVDEVAPKPDVSRGQCCLNFDNWTGYTLYVWVDDVFRGTIAPWDEDGLCVAGGWTSYYIRTAGGTYSWSDSGECQTNVNLRID
jgi:hypothetical protein